MHVTAVPFELSDTGVIILKKGTKQLIRRWGLFLFILYVLLLIYFLFFSEEYGRAADVERAYRYNLIPFLEIRRFWTYREQLGAFAVFANIAGNIIGFMPLGFILPVIIPRIRSCFFITLSGFLFSLFVEIIQLLTKVGCFDVDDLILNTVGTFLGCILFLLCDKIRRIYYGEKI